MKNKVLILGASEYNINAILSIKACGCDVYVLDGNPDAPGFKVSDKFATIDISNKEKVFKYALENSIQAIIPLNDFATPASSFASEMLNLTSPSFLSAKCGTDKGLMRDVWSLNNIPQPKYMVFDGDSVDYINTKLFDYPKIIKPALTGGGGRGISIIKSEDSFMDCFKHASKFSLNNRFIIEDFVPGTELTIDGFMYRSTFYPSAISDKYKPESVHRVATSLYFPAKIGAESKSIVVKMVEKASLALGLDSCAIHAEVIMKNNKKGFMVELGLRGGGGHLFGDIIKLHSGIDAPRELAKILLGKRPSLKPKNYNNVIYRFLNPALSGKFIKADFPEWIKHDKEVYKYGTMLKAGTFYNGLSDSLQRIGFVILFGGNRKKLDKKAKKIENSISYQFE